MQPADRKSKKFYSDISNYQLIVRQLRKESMISRMLVSKVANE